MVNLKANKEQCFKNSLNNQTSLKNLLSQVNQAVYQKNNDGIVGNLQPIIRSLCEVFASGTTNIQGDFSNMYSSSEKVLSAMGDKRIRSQFYLINQVTNEIKHVGISNTSINYQEVINSYNSFINLLNKHGKTTIFTQYKITKKPRTKNYPSTNKAKDNTKASQNHTTSFKLDTGEINYTCYINRCLIEEHKYFFLPSKKLIIEVSFTEKVIKNNVDVLSKKITVTVNKETYNLRNNRLILTLKDQIPKEITFDLEVSLRRKITMFKVEKPVFTKTFTYNL